MRIVSVLVRNFRSIRDQLLVCDDLTVLIGQNGSGKSSFLQALELFFSTSPNIHQDDFFNGDVTREIEVCVTFTNLEAEALSQFEKYCHGGDLKVSRIVRWEGGKSVSSLHGTTLHASAFSEIRNAGKAQEKIAAYDELRKNPPFDTLPSVTSAKTMEENLRVWEQTNQNACELCRDDGQFFGFKGVGSGYLNRYIRFLTIPAVRDAVDDASEGRGTVLTKLIDLLVRNALANRKEFAILKTQLQEQLEKLIEAEQLRELSGKVTSTLDNYTPGTAVRFDWQRIPDVEVPLPRADVRLTEHGFESSIERSGHGLQRGFILAILQHLAAAQAPSGEDFTDDKDPNKFSETTGEMPTLVLCIEEPELYQHPHRQRHISKTLLQLAIGSIPGVAKKTQIIYTSHSPLLIGLDRFDQLRLFRKTETGDGLPRTATISSVSLDAVSQNVWKSQGKPDNQFSSSTLRPRLISIMTPMMNEGFFADAVVLVEGEEDRAAILGAARESGFDLEKDGFSVIPCGGKPNIDRPAIIFQMLGIPTYMVWDSDNNKKEADRATHVNQALLRIARHSDVETLEAIEDNFACFENNLTDTIKSEIGASNYVEILEELKKEFANDRPDAIKNPMICEELIARARKRGLSCNSLDALITKIANLKLQTTTASNTASESPTCLVFAYGSNMSTAQMRTRCKSTFTTVGIGKLPGYELHFPLTSREERRTLADGTAGGVGSIRPTKDQKCMLEGVIYQIANTDLILLDQKEGVGSKKYRRVLMQIGTTEATTAECWVYIASADGNDYLPAKDYIRLYIEGAGEHGLSAEYKARLQDIKTG